MLVRRARLTPRPECGIRRTPPCLIPLGSSCKAVKEIIPVKGCKILNAHLSCSIIYLSVSSRRCRKCLLGDYIKYVYLKRISERR